MATIQTLIITMNKNDSNEIIKLLNFLNIETDTVVCNQTSFESDIQIKYKDNDVLIHNYIGKGVSLNRNTAASLSKADIILCVYLPRKG